MPRRFKGDATAPWDAQFRTRSVRQFFMDSVPVARGTKSAGSSATFLCNGATVDTGVGAAKLWHDVEHNHEINDFWEYPQEVMAFIHSATFTNPAGSQSVGIYIGGTGTINDGAESSGLGLMALRYMSATAKWQLRVWDGDLNSADYDCTAQPDAPAGVWLRLLFIPRGSARGGRFAQVQCWVGNPPVLIHTQSDAMTDGIGGGGADYGAGIFAQSGSNAAGRVSNFTFSHFHAISHMNIPGGVLAVV